MRKNDHEHTRQAEPMVAMATEHYAPYRWVQGPIALLALWLIASPSAFAVEDPRVIWNDVLSGLASLTLAAFSLRPQRGLLSWSQAVIGFWLLLAPLLFWTESAAVYANETIVGSLLIAFGFVTPMAMRMPGTAIPPGWSYNPASGPQRIPIVALGWLSFLVARHMAAYQLGHIPPIRDPLFGQGTTRVLDSEISRWWPISDAGLGAVTYLIEVLSACMGDPRRWRTMPWMVALFGLNVIPLGVVSITLIILQPIAVGAWCSPCLLTALFMLAMIPLSIDEVVAMIQFVVRRKREGASAWRVFWLGESMPERETDRRIPANEWTLHSFLMNLIGPPTLYVSIAAGAWAMAAPGVLGFGGPAADAAIIGGALVMVVAATAIAEVARPLRFLSVPFAAWIAVAPWIAGTGPGARWSGAAVALVVILCSIPLGQIRERYGSFDRWISPHIERARA